VRQRAGDIVVELWRHRDVVFDHDHAVVAREELVEAGANRLVQPEVVGPRNRHRLDPVERRDHFSHALDVFDRRSVTWTVREHVELLNPAAAQALQRALELLWPAVGKHHHRNGRRQRRLRAHHNRSA